MPSILGANTLSGGYDVANSCRFNNNADEAFMRITPSSAGNRKTWTWSSWIKKTVNGNQQVVFGAGENAGGGESNEMVLYFGDDDKFHFCTGGTCYKITNRVFRDVSAWYHIAVVVDSTDNTAADRIKIYVNGVRETSFGTSSNPDQNLDFAVNNTVKHDVSSFPRRPDGADHFFQGYQAECVLLDGTAAAITNLGEFDEDSGIWKPINVSGLTAGTNGFYLDFEDSSNLGNDVFGGTDLTESGLAATDQSTDTCTNNFATLNPLFPAGGTLTFSEGNTSISAPNDGNWKTTLATMAAQNGKWYMEFKSGGNYAMVGVCDFNITNRGIDGDNFGTKTTISAFGYGYYNGDGTVRYEGGTELSYGNTYGNNDIVGIALDCDNDKLYFSKNGTFQNSGDPTSGATGTNAVSLNTTAGRVWVFAFSIYQTNARFANFGSPAFAISSGNADANGHGNFEYAVPSGYFALNTKNLAEHG